MPDAPDCRAFGVALEVILVPGEEVDEGGGVEKSVKLGGELRTLHLLESPRKDQTLTHNDITHYQKIIVALTETKRLMGEIDAE